MATCDLPEESTIPDLTESQHRALREYTERHRAAPGKLAPHPITIARVLARDKPAACVDPVTGVTPDDYSGPDEYLPAIFERMDLAVRQIDGIDGWHVARSAWRLDLLPTTNSLSDAYHRRCGVVYGYPPSAIEHFINFPEVKVTHCDLARADIFPAEEIAYTIFVPYTHEKTEGKYEELITKGKSIRNRISQLSDVWELPELDAHAEAVYQDVAAVYSGEDGTFNAPTMFPPDEEVTPRDVESLLS